ncbi:hypothetical protein ABT168_08760 [Streptomyces sp. NPDC001793]|uniref:hypothetical protein n=1 Tax=Streptomyces sp. NPDC001793 TaxID=3154657 RepID=UPI00331F262B
MTVFCGCFMTSPYQHIDTATAVQLLSALSPGQSSDSTRTEYHDDADENSQRIATPNTDSRGCERAHERDDGEYPPETH